MSMHLKEIGGNVAPGAHAALVLDGAGYHLAASLAVPDNIWGAARIDETLG